MTQQSVADSLASRYRNIAQLARQEVEGLTDAQFDFTSDRWAWAEWSIRVNLSHMASVVFRWFLVRWGGVVFPDGVPFKDELAALAQSRYDRRLDDEKYWKVEDILTKLDQAVEMVEGILARPDVDTWLRKELSLDYASPYTRYAQFFPGMSRMDTDDISRIRVQLVATVWHVYFELVTHLYNIQRLKRAQDLTAAVTLPREGYWTLPDWDTSEP